ncbi:anthranilate phosphoribosyltransferase [Sphingomonas jejuensis]|uniref:Anthranilate phosphoribosyltransferase n=1 Tax=Sphingomonas jejuensis TaxID=904715 RepID=A0ABX0XKD4_9SPHN|nr:anthranilate phosphoribosyltransferase [Sphingomonas jejuensis]NJC33794.1 anthranilate phosphoribosyltransferase [Sphingomonas jejuensis]
MTTIARLPDPQLPLTPEVARQAFADILDGRAADADIAAFLTALADRGETTMEIVAAARALRERLIPVAAPDGAIDVCGTGGDGTHSVNVSTAVAIVVAACGVPVAKHGSRAASSLSGAADTLEAAGLDLEIATASGERSLAELGIAFLFASNHHPALRRLAPIRRAIRRRTIFNFLGPLANPAGVDRQLIGVAPAAMLGTYAEALRMLGVRSGMVVTGERPLDELSVVGPSMLVRLQDGHSLEERITPEEVGLDRYTIEDLRGGDARFNADALIAVLSGAPGAYRDAVLLNTAAALQVAGRAADWTARIDDARRAIDDGRALDLLRRWIAFR